METLGHIVCRNNEGKEEKHPVLINDKGAMWFPAHPEGFESESVIKALGGDVCGCCDFYVAIKNPVLLAFRLTFLNEKTTHCDDLHSKVIIKKSERYQAKKVEDPLSLPMNEKIERWRFNRNAARFKNAVRQSKCPGLADKMICLPIPSTFQHRDGISLNEEKGKTIIYLSSQWIEDIEKRGYALYDGYPVANLSQWNNQDGTPPDVLSLYMAKSIAKSSGKKTSFVYLSYVCPLGSEYMRTYQYGRVFKVAVDETSEELGE